MRLYREQHANLHGGIGIVWTTTFLIFPKLLPNLRLIKLSLEPLSSIGKHTHTTDREIYITFDYNILFNDKSKWNFINFCRKEHSHSAENIGNTSANIYAFKF